MQDEVGWRREDEREDGGSGAGQDDQVWPTAACKGSGFTRQLSLGFVPILPVSGNLPEPNKSNIQIRHFCSVYLKITFFWFGNKGILSLL